MSAKVEKHFPLLIGIVGTALAAVAIWRLSWLSGATSELFYAAAVQVGAIAIGFLATAQTVLISIEERAIIERLKEAGHYDILVTYMFSALHWSFMLVVVSGSTLLIDFDTVAAAYTDIAFLLWLVVAITTFLSCYRILWIYRKVLVPQKQRDRGL